MFGSVLTASASGLRVLPVRVEADISDGLPQFIMVGFLSAQVKEAQDRVRSAFRNSGLSIPSRRITVNLSPADLPKSGSRFDLPIALALLLAAGLIPSSALTGVMAVGELSLGGGILPVSGVLPTALLAREEGCSLLIVPSANKSEACEVEDLTVAGVSSLRELMDLLESGALPEPVKKERSCGGLNRYDVDFSDIRGQATAKRAAVISAAGFHNLLLIGSPGSGKTMIARRMPTILPELTRAESLEISQIYSVAGLLSEDRPLIETRPFRHPHHTISPHALAGGGRQPVPGEVTLAHRGVLFLDEFPEFSPSALEILREPLEDREITISRLSGSFRFPASFLLLAAMNPCRCGYFPDTNLCTCSARDISRYVSRISRPLLDRIDLCVQFNPVSLDDLLGAPGSELSSADMREMIRFAREIQLRRFSSTRLHFNSEIPPQEIGHWCRTAPGADRVLKAAFGRCSLSARGLHKILKTARTIADLSGEELIGEAHLREALMYRTIDEQYWRI